MKIPRQKPLLFQSEHLPTGTALAGLAALVRFFGVEAPVRRPACVSERHVKGGTRQAGIWRVYDKRYEPEETVTGQLTFALRHEDVDLLVLKRLFLAIPEPVMAEYVRSAPTGIANRRAWFLYELLTGRILDVPDAPTVTVVDVLDPNRYFTRPGEVSRRHKVRNNLLGTAHFCPIIRRTDALEASIGRGLAAKAQATVGLISARLVRRAASFLLLADSQASFAIEGERPPRNRLERWAKAIKQAGRYQLSLPEIIRLHGILIEDNRFVQPGLRKGGVFLGERGPDGQPLPEFIGAKPEDLEDLLEGIMRTNALMGESDLDPVLQAAATAFAFVYVHPFQDGNGRVHRCLVHHVLSERRFTPPGLIFPVSSVMLDWIEEYRTVLQSHSAPLMEYMEWRPTPARNVEVLNDTADLYRFIDCTDAAEFLYRCVERTVEKDLPHEIEYLKRRDEAIRRLMETVEMPDQVAEDFLMFVRQNNWTLPKKRRRSEFAALKDEEVAQLETVVREAFEGFDSAP